MSLSKKLGNWSDSIQAGSTSLSYAKKAFKDKGLDVNINKIFCQT